MWAHQVTWQINNVYFHFNETCGHKTRQDGSLWKEAANLRATCSLVDVVIWGHVTNKKTLHFNFPEAMSTKLETVMAYEKIVPWHVKNPCFHMDHDYQTRQDDGLWHWATMRKVTWLFDHVIICRLVTKKKRYIFNTTSTIGTKFDRVVAKRQLTH